MPISIPPILLDPNDTADTIAGKITKTVDIKKAEKIARAILNLCKVKAKARGERKTKTKTRKTKAEKANDELVKQNFLQLRAAWLRERPGTKVADWNRLSGLECFGYQQERSSRYAAALRAAWLADHGEALPEHLLSLQGTEAEAFDRWLDAWTARTPGAYDAAFDVIEAK
jgi:hypothetical protein